MGSSKIKDTHLARIAYIYIRQSTAYQAEHNLESQRRQYQLVEKAKAMGFLDVRVIDEDLGLSGGLSSNRSGFKRLVAEVGLNKVGIVLGLEVSRFARNNRDWYQLIDLCALFDTLIADQDGVYHPGHPNDRMVLGLKGTMSEVEINVLKSRMLEGAKNKAKRGELIYRLPVGLVKTDGNKIEKDPDIRVQKSIEQVFSKFRECQSIRQSFLWFLQEQLSFPSLIYGCYGVEKIWKRPVYGTIASVLKNPFYAGAYVYGRRESRTHLEGGEIKKTKGHLLEPQDWEVLLKDNHPGYISWEEYENNQEVISGNNARMAGLSRGAILGGSGLLGGLLRCKRCGRKLVVSYGGKQSSAARYSCCAGRIRRGEKDCIAFGGMRVDQAVSQAVLKVVEPFAIAASLKTADKMNAGIEEQHRLVELELESAQYEAQRAYRQYNKVDPENRLVCMELEKKWNNCLDRVERIKEKLSSLKKPAAPLTMKEKQDLFTLSSDLKKLWESPSTTNELRKRLVRTVLKEIICDVDEANHQILLTMHWEGGIHTELKVKRNRTGEHTRCTDKSIVELIRQLAKQLPDKSMAPVLNRLKLKTGAGNTWTRDRVKTLRNYHQIAPYSKNGETGMLSLRQAAEKLGICDQSVRSLIKQRIIEAEQVVFCAPWAIAAKELEKEEVKTAVKRIKSGSNRKKLYSRIEGQLEIF
jgi:DNA invertase Pin-like site-specific DNA recombinase